MRVIKNLLYDKEKHGSYHVNSGEVMTVPEDTMSMREIYNRFRNGQPLDVNHYDMNYSEDEYQDIDLERLDLVEIQELTQKYNQLAREHQRKMDEQLKRNPKNDENEK